MHCHNEVQSLTINGMNWIFKRFPNFPAIYRRYTISDAWVDGNCICADFVHTRASSFFHDGALNPAQINWWNTILFECLTVKWSAFVLAGVSARNVCIFLQHYHIPMDIPFRFVLDIQVFVLLLRGFRLLPSVSSLLSTLYYSLSSVAPLRCNTLATPRTTLTMVYTPQDLSHCPTHRCSAVF